MTGILTSSRLAKSGRDDKMNDRELIIACLKQSRPITIGVGPPPEVCVHLQYELRESGQWRSRCQKCRNEPDCHPNTCLYCGWRNQYEFKVCPKCGQKKGL
jgi:hypothetical protein